MTILRFSSEPLRDGSRQENTSHTPHWSIKLIEQAQDRIGNVVRAKVKNCELCGPCELMVGRA